MVNLKLTFAILATVIGIGGYIPYFRDIFLKKTKPHLYSWLVWLITQSTATVAFVYGKGGFGALSFVVGTILVFVVFILSFKYGTKNIKWNDVVSLAGALIAVLIWWQLDNPRLSVLLISIIDSVAFIPTFRKSLEEPWSETLSYWALMATSCILLILATAEYNFLTITYLATLTAGNSIVWTICFYRRKVVKNPAV